eukprot:3057067-Rhodomonas_salina.15
MVPGHSRLEESGVSLKFLFTYAPSSAHVAEPMIWCMLVVTSSFASTIAVYAVTSLRQVLSSTSRPSPWSTRYPCVLSNFPVPHVTLAQQHAHTERRPIGVGVRIDANVTASERNRELHSVLAGRVLAAFEDTATLNVIPLGTVIADLDPEGAHELVAPIAALDHYASNVLHLLYVDLQVVAIVGIQLEAPGQHKRIRRVQTALVVPVALLVVAPRSRRAMLGTRWAGCIRMPTPSRLRPGPVSYTHLRAHETEADL